MRYQTFAVGSMLAATMLMAATAFGADASDKAKVAQSTTGAGQGSDSSSPSTSPSMAREGGEQHIRMMQEALKREGHDPGPIDGILGPRTAAALKEYQKANNLQVTGQADAETLGKLGIGVGGASRPASGAEDKSRLDSKGQTDKATEGKKEKR